MNETIADAVESTIEDGFDADGNISDADMAAALTGGEIESKVEPEPEVEVEIQAESAEPEQPAEPEQVETKGGDDGKSELEPESESEPDGVMSKSGNSIIPYEDLMKERDGRHAERDRANNLQAELDKLIAERDEPEPTPSDDDDPEGYVATEDVEAFMDEFPEVAKQLQASSAMADKITSLEQQIAGQAEQRAQDLHFAEIAGAHKDYETALDGAEFETWFDAQPEIAQKAYAEVYEHGNASQVVEMLNTFKASIPNGNPETPAKTEVVKKNVDDVVSDAKIETKVPSSLSSVPGSASVNDESDLDMKQGGFMDKMSGMSAADQLAALDRML